MCDRTAEAVVSCVCCPLQANNPNLTRKEREMWNISVQGLIHLAAILVVDVLFHFMYILTIPSDVKLLKHVSDWAVGLFTSSDSYLSGFIVLFS